MKWFKLLPLLLIISGLVLVFYFDLNTYLSFDSLKIHRQSLLLWTKQNFWLVSLYFMGIYILAVTLSVPGAVFLTLAGGFLFGPIWGTTFVVISATIGATLLFFIVKLAISDWIAKKASSWIKKMSDGFKRDAFEYMLVLRLVPLFPFWAVNIVPAVLNIKSSTYIISTFIGIIPGSFVYVLVGNGLGAVFDSGKTPNLAIIFQPQILLPILGLALLSLIPVLYKRFFKDRYE
jgi:uncharacterized membrane protein YdjX (TVP38/TMEM64 family)